MEERAKINFSESEEEIKKELENIFNAVYEDYKNIIHEDHRNAPIVFKDHEELVAELLARINKLYEKAVKEEDQETKEKAENLLIELIKHVEINGVSITYAIARYRIAEAMKKSVEVKNSEKALKELLTRIYLVFLGLPNDQKSVSDEEAEQIRLLYDEGVHSMGELARIFNRSKATIYRVVSE